MLILTLDTPGGLLSSTREIVKSILASPVPVIGYVAPAGAHAASAGTYILYATSLAAMAPGTNIGAATPVQIGGGGGVPGLPSPNEPQPAKEKGKGGEAAKPGQAPLPTIEIKTANDAVALIRSLAELRGRNADWAEKAVREAATLNARQALEQHVIELVAPDITELLRAANGRKLVQAGQERTLRTDGIEVVRIEPDFMTKALGAIANPNVALILMLIGTYGLIFELMSPGAVAPGVIGAISLVLGLYALSELPLDYAGLALVVLGISFMIAEAFMPTFGILGFGGIAAFVIGAAMLDNTNVPAFQRIVQRHRRHGRDQRRVSDPAHGLCLALAKAQGRQRSRGVDWQRRRCLELGEWRRLRLGAGRALARAGRNGIRGGTKADCAKTGRLDPYCR